MSKDPVTNQPTPNQPTPHEPINHDGFEQEDLSSRSALYFLAGLVLVCLVVYFIAVSLLPITIFGLFAAAAWWVMEVVSRPRPRAEERLAELKNPRKRRDEASGKKTDAIDPGTIV